MGYYGVKSVCRPSAVHMSVCIFVSGQKVNLNEHQWLFTNVGMYFDIVEVWFGDC